MDMYDARVLHGQLPQPNFPTPPGGGPARLESNTTTVQREEVRLNTVPLFRS